MTRLRALVEAPAGLAAFSLYVHGGKHCRPPISRLGNKAGYAHVLAAVAGVRAGQGAGAYVWAEADADVRGLLRAYPDPAMLLRVAEIIRGWADEEPRALWERLRAERKARKPVEEAVAGWVVTGAWSMRRGQPDSGYTESRTHVGIGEGHGDPPEAMALRCTALASYAQIAASNRLVNVGGPDLMNTGKGGTTFGGEFARPAGETAAQCEHLAGFASASMLSYGSDPTRGFKATAGGDWPDDPPNVGSTADAFERVAGWVVEAQWAFRRGEPESGFNAGVTTATTWTDARGNVGIRPATTVESIARAMPPASRWPPVYVTARIPTAAELSEILGTPGDLEGVLYYSDPPYSGTTGYGADLTRAEVVSAAIEAASIGARVMVSEAVAIPELVALGWHATDIGGERRGQKRTFARVATEYVTTSFPPVERVERRTQVGLFGGAP